MESHWIVPFASGFAVMLAVISGLLLIWSECIYIRSIIRREADPNPVTWAIWTLGAGILVGVEFSTWNASETPWPIPLFYLVVIAALTGAIFLSAALIGHGGKYFGPVEALCLALAVGGAFVWYRYNVPAVAFWAALLVDFMGAVPTLKSARQRPQSEVLFPWQLTVLSSAVNVTSLFALMAIGQGSWTSMVFGTYYLIANAAILAPISAYHRKLRQVRPNLPL